MKTKSTTNTVSRPSEKAISKKGAKRLDNKGNKSVLTDVKLQAHGIINIKEDSFSEINNKNFCSTINYSNVCYF